MLFVTSSALSGSRIKMTKLNMDRINNKMLTQIIWRMAEMSTIFSPYSS